MHRQLTLFSIAIVVMCGHVVFAQDPLVEIRNIRPERVEFAGFVLDREQKVRIEGLGYEVEGRDRHPVFLSNAWILDSETRYIVWEMDGSYPRRHRHHIIEINEEVELPKGTYELYYSSYPYYDKWDNVESLGDLIHVVFDEIFDRNHWEDTYKDFEIKLFGEGSPVSPEEIYEIHRKKAESAVVAIQSVRNDRYEKQGFTLDRPMDLRLYAIGEIMRDGTYDYGWIINTDTREKVWKMDYRNTEYAGGAEKNRLADQVISLPQGNYAVLFITDDTHSYRRWNSPPPYDPFFWGITIWTDKPEMAEYTRLFDYDEAPKENVIAELTHARDDEHLSKAFTLKSDMSIRVYALGEGSDGEMYDYGWIENADTRRSVWKMRYYDTEHAGGSSKNRIFDGVVNLEKGSYIVHFVTDGSHSYRDWNTSKPFNPDAWGITILGAGDNFNPDNVTEYLEEEDTALLARITRMRDGRVRHENFSIQNDGEVRIYALGEGRSGDMFDYGWIEEAETGKVVWEMTYRNTDHAGGAHKNRVFNDTVFLKKGSYVVYFETDDSHSYSDWNSDPPYDQESWGITVRSAK